MTADDAAHAAAVHRHCFAHDPWPAKAFVTLLESGAEGFVAEAENGEVTGLILCRAAADEAEILTFAVLPDHRDLGIGYFLLNKAIESLVEKRIERLFLEVAKNNAPAISLYSKAGFATIGERSGYYVGPDGITDAYIMEKRLYS